MSDYENVQFTGYHGTDEGNFTSIFKNGFQPSSGDNHWLGEGIYFFIEGLNDPLVDAENWAKAESFQKKYNKFIVLTAKIESINTRIWDIRNLDGKKKFLEFKEMLIKKLLTSNGKNNQKKLGFIDYLIIKLASKDNKFDLIICELYIKLTKEDRINDIKSRIANTTVLNVLNFKTISEIKRVKGGFCG